MGRDETVKRVADFLSDVPDVDAGVVIAALELRRLHREIEGWFEELLEAEGMSGRRAEVMEALYFHPDQAMTPADLADEAILTRSAMTGLLDSLQRDDFVRREPHPKDRRMLLIVLTPHGKAFMDRTLVGRYRHVAEIVRVLSAEQRETMLALYRKVADRVREISVVTD